MKIGRLTEGQVETFRRFLDKAGPQQGPWTEDQLKFRIDCLQDPYWLESLGIDNRQAALALGRYRADLWRLREERWRTSRARRAG